MKKIKLVTIIVAASLVWLVIFGMFVGLYMSMQTDLSSIEKNAKELDNLNYVRRNYDNLLWEYDSIGSQSFSSKSTAEFISKLPTLGELTGVKRMVIENTGVKKQDKFEITELKINASSSFPNMANFIDILERSKLPIQISSLTMSFQNSQLNTVLVVMIYKKLIEE